MNEADQASFGHHTEPIRVSGVSGTPGGGPYIVLELTFQNGRIASVAVDSNGCPAAIECSRLAARLVFNRTREEASGLEPSDLLLILREFQGPKERYAPMAVEALQNALRQLK